MKTVADTLDELQAHYPGRRLVVLVECPAEEGARREVDAICRGRFELYADLVDIAHNRTTGGEITRIPRGAEQS